MARSEETSRRINPRKCVVRSSCPSAGLRPKRTTGLARRWTSAGWTNKKNRESLFGERFDERRCIGVIYQGNSFSLSLFSLRYVSLSGSGFRWSLPRTPEPNERSRFRISEPLFVHLVRWLVRASRCRQWITGFSTGQLVPFHPFHRATTFRLDGPKRR